MPSLEEVANVVLRVPPIVLLDVMYRWDVEAIRGELRLPSSSIQSKLIYCGYYLAHAVCAVLVVLPLRHLLNIYLYLLASSLLHAAHLTSRDYTRQEMDVGVPEDGTPLARSVSTLTGLTIVCTLCSLLMTRQAWLFSAPLLPILAHLCGLPLHSLPIIHAASTATTLLVMCYVAASGLRPLCRLFTHAYQEVTQVMEVYRLVALGVALWSHVALPAILLVFWLVLYFLQVYSVLSSKLGVLQQQGPTFILLSSVSECCGTPYCLLGLTFTVSYLSLGMLNLCKLYLMGYAALQEGNAMHRGVTEGVTMMLLSLQTGLLEMQVLQRTFLLSIIFFIVLTSTLQSMMDIAHPVLLGLAATGNRSVWRHVRGLSLCLFLLTFPTFMAYKIAYFFHMDFWLLILVSSCLLTSLQVLGTLFIYVLFMMELFQERRVERMDDIIYGVNAISRVLEFLVALCVVAYGTWESILGEWSWMGVSVIIVHSYFNVWLRAQSGWKSFLLRREAARKIRHLPRATWEELRDHNDVCSICFQEMSLAVITPCGHFFHADCLKKWLYIQDTCPLCHKLVRPVDRSDEGEDNEDSDSDERSAEGHGGFQGRRKHEGEAPEENTDEESQARDCEEKRTFVGENHHVVEEDTFLENHHAVEDTYQEISHVVEEDTYQDNYHVVEEDTFQENHHVVEEDTFQENHHAVEEDTYQENRHVVELDTYQEIKDMGEEDTYQEINHMVEEDTYQENQQVVEEDTYQQTEQEAENVCRKVDDVLSEREEHLLSSGLEDCYRKEQEEVHYMEKQEEVFHVAQPGKEVISECVLVHRGEQGKGSHCMKEPKKEFFNSENERTFYMEDQFSAPFRQAVQIPLGEEKNGHYLEERDPGVPCTEETFLYKEGQEVVPTKKVGQAPNKELEEHPYMGSLMEDVSCRKEKIHHNEEEKASKEAMEVPYRGAEKTSEDTLYRKEPMEGPYRGAEKTSEDTLYRKEQEVVPSGEPIQALQGGGGEVGLQ